MIDLDLVSRIRKKMKEENLCAFIIPKADPFLIEETPENWNFVKKIIGFNGSRGIVVISDSKLALFVDGRYIEKARKQFENTEVEVLDINYKSLMLWIDFITKNDFSKFIGLEYDLFSVNDLKKLRLNLGRMKLKRSKILYNVLRPESLNLKSCYFYRPYIDPKKAKDRLQQIRDIMVIRNLDYCVIVEPSANSWLYGLRANDLNFSQAVLMTSIVGRDNCWIYIDEDRLHNDKLDILNCFKNYNITVRFTEKFEEDLKNLTGIVSVDPEVTNCLWWSFLNNCDKIVATTCPARFLRMNKSDIELQGMQEAHLLDAIALCKFLYKVDSLAFDFQNDKNIKITEQYLSDLLDKYRHKSDSFVGLSFKTILAFPPNSAFPHYSELESDKSVDFNSCFLVDSGAHYLSGTTDVTRMWYFGNSFYDDSDWKKKCTLVLQAMIEGCILKFPIGTTASQVDAIVRNNLWKNLMKYNHGSGHGVGVCLEVHEKPVVINGDSNDILSENMIFSIEPGYYLPNKGGIRHENLVVVKKLDDNWLKFEQLTLIPFDHRLIDFSLLNKDHKIWLIEYHKQIIDLLYPSFKNEESLSNWLVKVCNPFLQLKL